MGNYDYIMATDSSDAEKVDSLYRACITFMNNCESPRHLEGRTLTNMKVFGVGAVSESTGKKLNKWAEAICSIETKVRANTTFYLGMDTDSRRFSQLVKICQAILV